MQLGDYKCRVSIRAGQVVEQLSMVLNITEPDGIVRLSTTGPEQEGVVNPYVNVEQSATGTQAIVRYLPTAEAQQAVHNNLGIAGDLVVSYDVNHQNGIGDITVVQDTVIHSFSPKDLPPLPKNIAFVIDTSGSMSGRKIEQTFQAMMTILDQLREEDMFMIILFESSLIYWPTIYAEYEGEMIRPEIAAPDPITEIQIPQYPDIPAATGSGRTLLFPPAPAPALAASPSAPYHLNRGKRQAPGSNAGVPWSQKRIPPPPAGAYPVHRIPEPPVSSRNIAGMVQATDRNIALAKQFVNRIITASGGTNINLALLEACRILRSQRRTKRNLILFLTDGSPTSGVTDPRSIVENVATAAKETRNSDQISIYSLAFGFNLNYDLLEMISLSTEGKVKRIYAESDAADQLRNFYQEISTPLMYNLDFIPDSNIVDQETITQHKFPTYFNGSEVLVMWKIKPELLDINVELDRKKRSQDREDVYIIRCGVKLGGYARQPMEYNTKIEIDPRITLASKDYKAREIDCLHVDDPEYNNISNSKWAPTEFAERMWANLKIKNLLKVSKLSKSERKKWQAEKRAICLALKYHLVTPLTSLLIVQGPPVPPEPSGNPISYGSGGARGESGPAGPWGQGERGVMAPRAQPWPPGLPGREEYEERQLRAGQRGEPGSRGEEREDGRSEEREPQGPPVQQEQRPYGSVVPGGDRGLPGQTEISCLRGENEQLPRITGSRLHTSITTTQSTTSPSSPTITSRMPISSRTTKNTTTSTASSVPTTTTTEHQQLSTTTTVYLQDTENKTDTECRDEICDNPIPPGQSNAGSESLANRHVNQSIQIANTAEPKAVPVSKQSGSVALNSSLYAIVNVVLLLIVSSDFS